MFFDELVAFRLQKSDMKIVGKIVRKDHDRYDNESHFYRCAVIRLINSERRRLKL